MKEFNILHNVTIEILNYCNSACIHCYLDCAAHKENKLEYVMQVIDQAREAGALQITITGGEPLLHPNIVEIIRYIKRKEMAVNLLTSLNVRFGKWIECLYLCDKVGVSLYGSSKEVHDKITRINGSFENMKNNLMYLVENKVFTTLNVTVMKENIEDLGNMIAFANKTTSRYRVNCFLHGASSERHQIDYECLELLKNTVVLSDNTRNLSENFKCIAGSESLWVDTDLNVFPCVFFRKQLGNLFNQTLLDIWNGSASLALIRHTSNVDFKKCRACELKNICKPCIGENYNVNRDITIPCAFSCNVGKYGKLLMEC